MTSTEQSTAPHLSLVQLAALRDLREVRQVLTSIGWSQGGWCKRSEDNNPIGYCLGGAIAAVVSGGRYSSPNVLPEGQRRAFRAVADELVPLLAFPEGVDSCFFTDTDKIINWNDDADRDRQQVIDLVDRAIVRLESIRAEAGK